jgi:hypothetical protein
MVININSFKIDELYYLLLLHRGIKSFPLSLKYESLTVLFCVIVGIENMISYRLLFTIKNIEFFNNFFIIKNLKIKHYEQIDLQEKYLVLVFT